MKTPDLEAAGLHVNRTGSLWAGRIVDHAFARSLVAAIRDDLRPHPQTTLQRLIDALDADDGETTIIDES